MKNLFVKRIFIVTMFLISFLIIASPARAADSLYYPSQTPQTTVDPVKFDPPYTTVTVEVFPKLYAIPQGSAQTWTVVITYMVTAAGSGKVNSAQVRELELVWNNDLVSGYSITTPQGGDVIGPTPLPGNKWDIFVNLNSGYFAEGTAFVLTFHITTPDSLAPGTYHLVKTWHRSYGDFSGQESSSDYGIVIVFDVVPSKVIPEVPLGPIIATVSMIAAFGVFYGFKKQRLHFPKL